jgi:predicted  nucleic acid-binding Zn-ribbon protein
MTIDERLEKLAERHEALTQSLELLHHDVQAQRATVDELVTAARQDGENIRALAHIAEIHERRRTDPEGGE